MTRREMEPDDDQSSSASDAQPTPKQPLPDPPPNWSTTTEHGEPSPGRPSNPYLGPPHHRGEDD